MKRTILLSIFLLCSSLCSFAQIKRDILGITVGKTTYKSACSIFNHKGIESTDKSMYFVENVKFAGLQWDYVKLVHYQGVVYMIQFTSSHTNNFDYLVAMYKSKYSNYIGENLSNVIQFNDGVTNVFVDTVQNELHIIYIDDNLAHKVMGMDDI